MKNDFFFSSLALIFFSLAVFGAFKSFSFIPYWDMWEAYLNFYSRAPLNDFSIWWEQHNEHRPIISKLFFLIDFVLFDGRIWFLIFLNYLLVALGCVFFYLFAKELEILDYKWFTFFIIIWLYSFIQKENLNWGFQSQFFLAYLLPLVSLYFLQKSTKNENLLDSSFLFASFFSILSVFTMANGMLILILNSVYTIILRMSLKRIFFSITLSIIFCSLYLHDYSSPTHLGFGTITSSLQNNPLGMLHYTFLYLGNPFYYFFGKGDFGQIITICFSIFLITSIAIFSLRALKLNKQKQNTIIALVFFIIFVICTAAVTSGGRIIYGAQQSLNSRYTTPVLMAWLALFLLYLQMVKFSYPSIQSKIKVIFIVLVILMLPRQLKVFEIFEQGFHSLQSTHSQIFKINQKNLFEKKIAALALELRINDLNQFKYVYHSPDRILQLTKNSFMKNLSFFGYEPYKNTNEMINKEIELKKYNNSKCFGKINKFEIIDSDPLYLVLQGTIETTLNENLPKKFYLTSEKGLINGVVFTHKLASKNKLIGQKEYYFKGYNYDSNEQKIVFVSNNKNCFFSVIK